MARVKKLLEMANENTNKNRTSELEQAIDFVVANDSVCKALEKQLKDRKSLIKEICLELGNDTYESQSGHTVKLTRVDKSFLQPEQTLEYLKNNGLEKYIRTKEYFDEAEIAMAIAHGDIKGEELAPFIVKQEEIRLNPIK